jgi:hypothetical protein
MEKYVYFKPFDEAGWPSPRQLQDYFLTASGRRQAFEVGNDCWGLSANGVEGTGHMPAGKGRVDITLTIVGNLGHGVFLQYDRFGGLSSEVYFSKGDAERLQQWVETRHGDLRPIGLFIPFERAWIAIKEFIETDGALPQSIAWISSDDIPPGTFPDPGELPKQK